MWSSSIAHNPEMDRYLGNSLRGDESPLGAIRVRGARQNNLKNLNLDIPLGEIVVVTGVSGSGKSSLVFDTIYAEGQRRYVETFSPYARQFLDRMDRPQVDRIDGVPPAIAIDQTNPVRTSRSTVGTMTELADHLKLLFAKCANLYCRQCGRKVNRDQPESILNTLEYGLSDDARVFITFPVPVPVTLPEAELEQLLAAQGYTRIHARREKQGKVTLDVLQDRLKWKRGDVALASRMREALEAAIKSGKGRVDVQVSSHASNAEEPDAVSATHHFSTDLHCAACDIHYKDALPSSFSFNNPIGACDACRGFGRVIGIDYGLVIPDDRKSLQQGCIKPWQTPSFKECQADLLKYAMRDGIPTATPWRDLTDEQRAWVMNGQPKFKTWERDWYGLKRFFDWLESRTYKMHVRVLLSKYRSYTPCQACGGARLKPESLLWRLGDHALARVALAGQAAFRPTEVQWSTEALNTLPGLSMHDLNTVPIDRARTFFDALRFEGAKDVATELLLTEIRSRLRYLCDVGLGYLTLDRQGRTLSGGEVQRINLTTALGTSLTNTLFVLDEPSIGLHPRDVGRLNQVLRRLKQSGNSLLVVEHDPQVMLVADRMLEIGPGPGERGGSIVAEYISNGQKKHDTLTSKYLSGELKVDTGTQRKRLRRGEDGSLLAPRIIVEGAREHNLKNVTLELPLDCLVAITGVSGSGKSSLMADVLYPALAKAKGKAVESIGEHHRLLGADQVSEVVLVDQTPLGKSARSNPVSFVGAFDGVRQLFAAHPESRQRGYTAGTFSFNTGDGRCPTCGGTGFQHVEMQFLSDVYLRCPDCDGKRFRAEVLEVVLELSGRRLSVSDVLDLTVSEAIQLFARHGDIVQPLRALADVGLEYLRLGQPTPTLSGGEAQRLKLSGYLAQAYASTSKPRVADIGSLFLFDEPTTGLHFDDIAKLLKSLRKLIDAGHSVAVIEHNLDVIRASDWVIDLGPEGGDRGGEIVAAGTPDEVVAQAERSHTGRELRDYIARLESPSSSGGLTELPMSAALLAEEPNAEYLASAMRGGKRGFVSIVNAREHNLKNVQVDIPHGKFTVITGVSGSGKSTLAFDVLFNEGQRRYLESLNAYARQFVQPAAKPDVDAIFGIPPTVAIEQRTSRGGRKSTVATMTEVYHFIRLMYAKLGTQHCPKCKVPIAPQSEDAIVAAIMRQYKGQHIGLLAPLVLQRKGYYTDLAIWAKNKGHTHLRVDGEFLSTVKWPRLDRFKEHTIELPMGDLVVSPDCEARLRVLVRDALAQGRGVMHLMTGMAAVEEQFGKSPNRNPDVDRVVAHGSPVTGDQVFSTKRACPVCGTSFREPDPRLFSYNSPVGWCEGCYGTGLRLAGFDGEQSGEEQGWSDVDGQTCDRCDGQRLNPVALHVLFRSLNIAQLAGMTVDEAGEWFGALKLSEAEEQIARDALSETRHRIAFLKRVGLGYLSLNRAAPTLSGGEAQRIRLAAQLGSSLQGVCYVLDEPTIGLHPRDNQILLSALDDLRRKGNTLVVVEHDEDTIRRADHLIDIGPGAGKRGGQIIASGTPQDVMKNPSSLTARYLREPLQHPFIMHRKTSTASDAIRVSNAGLNNLRDVTAQFPLARLTVVTGVSGSGKSTLAREVLLAGMKQTVSGQSGKVFAHAQIDGWKTIERVLEVDQTPIGKTPRSCPATYVGIWDDIRKLMAEMPEAKMRGYSASRFSFNTGDGRCPSCEGAGALRIEMNFLPDVTVPCDMCHGLRFNKETLEVRLRGKNAGEILLMDIDEAVEFFSAHRKIHHALKLMQDVGLGYLQLGQPSPFLSGGEAQRIKLVTELATAGARPTLYVLDEPTVGLHMADVDKLIRVLHRLVDAGHTVVTIEHNLDVIAEADWIVDMGPEGGAGGGRVVHQGTPSSFIAAPEIGHTARVLHDFLLTNKPVEMENS
jgi:excinuclease ABC subunit A